MYLFVSDVLYLSRSRNEEQFPPLEWRKEEGKGQRYPYAGVLWRAQALTGLPFQVSAISRRCCEDFLGLKMKVVLFTYFEVYPMHNKCDGK